jgi:hypothetical protein
MVDVAGRFAPTHRQVRELLPGELHSRLDEVAALEPLTLDAVEHTDRRSDRPSGDALRGIESEMDGAVREELAYEAVNSRADA